MEGDISSLKYLGFWSILSIISAYKHILQMYNKMHGKEKCKVEVRVPSGEDIRERVLLGSFDSIQYGLLLRAGSNR